MHGGSPDLLRLITCGSVDDGKSTLIGRLMAEAGAVPEDVLAQTVRRPASRLIKNRRCASSPAAAWTTARAP